MAATSTGITGVDFLPSFRLEFPTGSNEYRLRNNQIDFRVGRGTWRTLQPGDVQMHIALATEVAAWIRRTVTDPTRL